MFGSRGRDSQQMPRGEKLIFSLGEIDIDVIPLVGEKVLSVAKLSKAEIPVPDAFAISTRMFSEFFTLTGLDTKLREQTDILMTSVKDQTAIRNFSTKVKDLIRNAKFPSDISYDIEKAYSRLSGFSDSFVAVRSSIMSDILSESDFTGQLYTELNVKGKENVIETVKKCYSSLFEMHVVEYALDKKIDISKIQMAVLIQKMVQAEVSGVMFTIDPVTNDPSLLMMESVYGLGDVINTGEVSPDQYTVSKKKFEIRERRVVPQEYMHVLSKNKNGYSTEEVRISPSWQSKQKLEDKKIIELSEIGIEVEKYFKSPQDIEWVMESGHFWILQSRSAFKLDEEALSKVSSEPSDKVYTEKIAELLVEEELRNKEVVLPDSSSSSSQEFETKGIDLKVKENLVTDKKVGISSDIQVASKDFIQKGQGMLMGQDPSKLLIYSPVKKAGTDGVLDDNNIESKNDELLSINHAREESFRKLISSKLRLLLTGIAAGHGIVSGKVNIILYEEEKESIETGDIVVIKGDNASWISSYPHIGGLITDFAGATSDVAIIARKNNISCVVDTRIATKLLRQGEQITIDGSTGKIYEGNLADEDLEKVKINGRKNEGMSSVSTLESDLKSSRKRPESNKVSETSLVDRDVAETETLQKPQLPKKKTVVIEGQTVEVQDIKIITATKTLLDFSRSEQIRNYKHQPYSIADGIGILSGNAIIELIGTHPGAFIAEKNEKEFVQKFVEILKTLSEKINPLPIIYHLSDLTHHEYNLLKKGKSTEAQYKGVSAKRGVERHLETPKLLRLELNALKYVRNKLGYKNISLSFSYVRSNSDLMDIKREIASLGLRRSKSFNLYLNPTVPANIFDMDKILESGIDGMLIEPTKFASAILGTEITGDKAFKKYVVNNETVLAALEALISRVNSNKLKSIVCLESSGKEFVKNLVEWGANSIVIDGTEMSLMQREIRDIENGLVMKKSRRR